MQTIQNIAEYQIGLALIVYKFFDKKSKGTGIKFMPSQQLPNEFHKPIIKNFKKRKVYSSFKENIWDVVLADIQLLSKYNKGIRYFQSATDLFSKYAFVVPLKDKNGTSLTNTFQSILNNLNRKPNKI